MGFRHPLIHHSPATAADQIPKPVAQEPVLFEGDDGLAMLPAQAQIIAPAVLAPLNRDLICCHGHPSLSATHNTTKTRNSQEHGPEFKESYHLGGLVRHCIHYQRHPNPGCAVGTFPRRSVLLFTALQFLRGKHSLPRPCRLGAWSVNRFQLPSSVWPAPPGHRRRSRVPALPQCPAPAGAQR